MKRIGIIIVCFLMVALGYAQQGPDVQHYTYSVALNDTNDVITCRAEVQGIVLNAGNDITLDLAQLDETTKKGMTVTDVKGIGVSGFKQTAEKLIINYKDGLQANQQFDLQIDYHGVPADGLIISKTKFGSRSFFSDNWPNRAHHWIPCNDQPGDKATVDFIVTAPAHYQVVSNGVQVEETNLPSNLKLTHWKEDVPLPSKIMVIGVAEFAVNSAGEVNCIPLYSWVYPQNKEMGFHDYAQAKEILLYLINYIGPYPYKKLANVQSKTTFGGMENANTIFYYENSVTGDQKEESLISHEIVHQWFGNMATEKSFAHVWLSEGFATYLTHIYIESRYGTDSMNKEMQEDRQKVFAFAKTSGMAVVDSVTPYLKLLNANSYQKGGWVLHMLRRTVGDDTFHRIIRRYYEEYKGRNADTRDFQAIAEKVSGRQLGYFFDQWLYRPGVPRLKIGWKWMGKEKKVVLNYQQTQEGTPFQFPLELGMQSGDGKMKIQKINIDKKNGTISIGTTAKPVGIIADPNSSILAEVVIEALK